MSQLDLQWIREQFPALAETIHGQPAIFFDAPGGTQVPHRVIQAMVDYLTQRNSNVHGQFATSQRTDQTVEAARLAMADFLNCAVDEVMFGPNMTSLTFDLSRAIGREIQPGDEIIVTRLDHDANVAPWKSLEERGAVIKLVDIDVEDCTLDMNDFRAQLSERTKIVAVGYASNAVGTINDLATIIQEAHAVGAMVFIDAVHYAPHGPIDVQQLDCDFLACSPYKFFAPHMGTIYGKREHLQRLQPYKVRPASNDGPDRWETGTKNHEGMAGVTAAIEYLADLGRYHAAGQSFASRREALVYAMNLIRAYERSLSEQLVAGLLAIPGLTFYGISDPARFAERTPTVSIRIAGKHPAEIARRLGEQGIFTWDGNYYAINLSERLGVEPDGGMVRIGAAHYSTSAEIDRLLVALREIATAEA